MRKDRPSLTIGIEEEYLLVDRATRDVASHPPKAMLRECERRLGGRVAPELLRSQVEVGTSVCRNVQQARSELAELRATVAACAGEHGLGLVAVSTHPFAHWRHQTHTEKERYRAITEELEVVARRALICGMHVHVAIEDPEMRIDIMNQVRYFLPYLLALSASSPFWQGEPTGLSAYRLSIFHELPRTGIPERLASHSEFERLIAQLVSVGVIEDGTKLWWDVRPSVRFPTLEMRITDVCTRLDDAITIAALFQCIVRMLWRLRARNQRWRIYPLLLMNENRWRAQRYGTDGKMIDFGKWHAVPFADLTEEVLELTRDDAEALGCVAEVAHVREIPSRGTSAHTQMHVYQAALAGGADQQEALRAVVDWLIEETTRGLEASGAVKDRKGSAPSNSPGSPAG